MSRKRKGNDHESRAQREGKDRFAKLVMQQSRKLGDTRKMQYDRGRFAIVFDDVHFINLGERYRFYCGLTPLLRAAFIQDDLLAKLLMAVPLPSRLDDAKPYLMPQLMSRGFREIHVLQNAAFHSPQPEWPRMVIGDHLFVGPIYDGPWGKRGVLQEHLDAWQLSREEVMTIAMENLRRAFIPTFHKDPAADLYILNWDANYNAVCLFLKCPHSVRGELITMVPCRGMLLMTGSEDDKGLVVMAKLAGQALARAQFGNRLTGFAFRWRGDELAPWLPREESLSYAALKSLQMQSLAESYNEQKNLRSILAERETGNSVVVADYLRPDPKNSDELDSGCVWTAAPKLLLPETDVISFQRADGLLRDNPVVTAPRHRVLEIVGHHMKPLAMYPPRYLVEGFPSCDELARIAGA